MAVTRNVHRLKASIRDSSAWGTNVWDGSNMKRSSESRLFTFLNTHLASNERIVGTHYDGGIWVIITETYGLGPPDKGTPQ